MRIARKLSADHDIITRFITVLGGGMIEISSNQFAQPGFFIMAHGFISEYIEGTFFKKEELLIKALEDIGFPSDNGAIGFMRSDQKKSREASEQLFKAAKEWQSGDKSARVDVGWAASEYTATLRQHLERLKNLVFPLLEQNLTTEEKYKIAEGFNTILFEAEAQNAPDKYDKLIETLQEELYDWA